MEEEFKGDKTLDKAIRGSNYSNPSEVIKFWPWALVPNRLKKYILKTNENHQDFTSICD